MISFPFTSESGDRKVYTKDFRALFKSYFSNGVFNGGFAVTPATGMKVNVSAGWCNIEGCFGYSEDTVEQTIETVSTETYFNIVLRLDDNKANRNIDIYVVKGTSSPAQLTRNDTIYELCLARIKVGASDTSITLDMIEDTRLKNDLCGIVANAVQVLDTDTYYQQFQGALDEYLEFVASALDETLAGNLQKQITQNSSNIIDLQQSLNETDKYVNLKYSTAEQWTGKYWIDGKKIYAKVISGSFQYGNNVLNNVDKLLRYYGFADIDSDRRTIPYFENKNNIYFEQTKEDKTKVNFYIVKEGSTYNTNNCQIVLFYTKVE